MRTPEQLCGKFAEDAARVYLEAQGLKFVTSNYHCKSGEIDLVMQDDEYMVFVEVRYRKLSGYGDGVESITQQKKRKIIAAAKWYLLENHLFDKILCRFDVIAASPDSAKKILWVKDAFWA